MARSNSLWEQGLKQAMMMVGRITLRQESELKRVAAEDPAAQSAATPHELSAALEPLIRGIRAGNRRPPPPNRKAYRAKRALSTAEAARAEISTWRSERRAAHLEWVRAFRERFLGGATLDREKAIEFLTAAPYRLLTVGDIVQAGWPTVGLHGTECPPTLPNGRRVLGEQSIKTRLGRAVLIARYGVHCSWMGATGEVESRKIVAEVPIDGEHELPTLEWQDGPAENPHEAGVGRSTYRRGSAIAELAELADHVAACMWWPRPLAVWFVVTGQVPASTGVEVRLSVPPVAQNPLTELRIVLTVEPWVSRSAVDRAYQDAQRWAVGTGRPFKLKRASEEMALKRFLFVSRKLEAGITSFREMAEAWASESGTRGQEARISAKKLKRDYVRTRDAILRPLAMGRSKQDMPLAKVIVRIKGKQDPAPKRRRNVKRPGILPRHRPT